MSKDLRGIFNSITPENIKKIPLIEKAMDIFIENIEENAGVAESIKNIYNNNYDENDNLHVQDSKLNLRKGLLEVYLSVLYNVLKDAQNNEVIKAKFEQAGITSDSNSPFLRDVERIISDEYFITNKKFKEKLGTELSINYAYNLTKYLESAQITNDLVITEVKPFHFTSVGSVIKEMYENIVKPLSHPLGFTYDYRQIIEESINDLFGIIITYNIHSIEIRNIDGRFVVFTPDSDDTNIKAEFLQRTNILTDNLFTENEYNELVTVYTDKVVDIFIDRTIEDRTFRSILFTDGTYLQHLTNPVEILYIEYIDFVNENYENVLQDFSDHWSVYIDYETDIEFTYEEEIEQFIIEFEITKVVDEDSEPGQNYFFLEQDTTAFHVGGDDYPYFYGLDESKNAYTDGASLLTEINSHFTVSLMGSSQWPDEITFTITDDFGNSVESTVVPSGGTFSAGLNTYDLQGDNYTIKGSLIDSTNGNIHSHYYKTSGLNFTDANDFRFVSVDDNNHVIADTIRIIAKGPISSTIKLDVYDINNNLVTGNYATDINGDLDEVITLDVLQQAGDFRVIGSVMVSGKPVQTAIYESDNLRTPDGTALKFDIITFPGTIPNLTGLLDNTVLADPSLMTGETSTANYIIKEIGELAVDMTYAPADGDLLTYMIDNSITDIADLPGYLLLNGRFYYGNDYEQSNSDNLITEQTFINLGRTVEPINTSDFIVATSPVYVEEDFIIYSYSDSGYYLYTEEETGSDLYFNTNDSFYLFTQGDETIEGVELGVGPNISYYDTVSALTPSMHLRFDETASDGVTANDETGTYNGTYTGGVSSGTSLIFEEPGNSVVFNGTDSYVSLPNSLNTLISNVDFSIEFHVGHGTNATYVLSRGVVNTGGLEYGFNAYAIDTGVVMYYNIGNAILSRAIFTTTVPEGAHIVMTRIASTGVVECFVNGVSVGTDTTEIGAIAYHASHDVGFNIGAQLRNLSDTYSDGTIDELLIYNRILTPTEISDNYNASVG